MNTKHVFRTSIFMLTFFILSFVSCSDGNSIEEEEQAEDITELMRASEIDVVGEIVSDIIIDSYEIQENDELNRMVSSSSFLPSCVVVTIVAEQGFREVTLDFGTEGCIVNEHLLRGQIVFSYTRNTEVQEILISYSLIDFYFDTNNIIGSKTILRQLSNGNGNPQFTHNLDLTIVWPNGLQANREGVKVREWVEGFGSGIFSDNVFEITGNWTTTFVNGNQHTYEVLSPLRRQVICNYFLSGTVDVQRTNFGGTFDYGSGVCDNQATFTFNNGYQIDIILN
ncbi:hypothetical protein [Psychroserpens sp.]|uniref:hypothetical protein n=1 Tax=Psychroserpens sp. TaxID=2020870 RepID=UPI00385D802A